MSANDPGEPALVGHLRALALIAVAAGAIGSFGFMLQAGERTPGLLLLAFAFWILSPFAALAWANRVSTHWPALTRVALYGISLVVALGSVLIYGGFVTIAPPGSPNAFAFVVVAPGSWALMTVTVAAASLISRGRSRR